jgi:uncharacterized protein DUF5808
MTREEIEACWNDPGNRRWGVYYCKADPRVIVPRHRKWMGWTINAARPSAIPIVLLLVALCLAVPLFIVKAKGGGTGAKFVTVAAGITVLCLLSAYLSARTS